MSSTLKKVSLICYPDSCEIELSLLKLEEYIESYAYILHDSDFEADGLTLRKPHYHLILTFNKPVNVSTIKSTFNTKVYKTIKNFDMAICYLIHKFDLDKFQYDVKDICFKNLDILTILNNTSINFDDDITTLKMILSYIDFNKPSYKDLITFCINNSLYYHLRKNYSIIKDYMK